MMTTIFAALASFFLAYKGDIAAKMVASAGYDLLKKGLNFKPLIEKLQGYFSDKDDSEKFVRSICDTTVPTDAAPLDVLSQDYKKITGVEIPDQMVNVLKEWFEENQEAIAQINSVHIEHNSGFAVGVQNAKGNIYNVKGDYNVNEQKKED